MVPRLAQICVVGLALRMGVRDVVQRDVRICNVVRADLEGHRDVVPAVRGWGAGMMMARRSTASVITTGPSMASGMDEVAVTRITTPATSGGVALFLVLGALLQKEPVEPFADLGIG